MNIFLCFPVKMEFVSYRIQEIESELEELKKNLKMLEEEFEKVPQQLEAYVRDTFQTDCKVVWHKSGKRKNPCFDTMFTLYFHNDAYTIAYKEMTRGSAWTVRRAEDTTRMDDVAQKIQTDIREKRVIPILAPCEFDLDRETLAKKFIHRPS